MEQDGDVVRLTTRGRLLSNEVFERFVSSETHQNINAETAKVRRVR